MLRISDIVWWAFKSLGEARARSILSIVGVAISAALIVGVVTLTSSYSVEAQKVISSAFNPKTIVLVPRATFFTDVDVLKVKSVEYVRVVVPAFSITCRVVGGMGPPKEVTAIATRLSELHALIPSLRLAAGVEADQPGTLIAGWFVAHPANQATQYLSPGMTVYLDCHGIRRRYTVSGIYNPVGIAPMIDVDHSVFVPIEDIANMLGIRVYSLIYIIVDDVKNVDRVVNTLSSIYRGAAEVVSFRSIAESFTRFTSLLTMFFLSLASMSTIVAGIGITSTMMMSVQQRAREIGVLKAIGYTSQQVLILFLAEAILIGLFGGVIGSMAGLLVGYVLTRSIIGILTYVVDPLGILMTIIYSVVVAIAAGIYPAWRASRVEPVVVLRGE
ncbi:MAG TPA: ABC transporter permease [Pyrodictium sp.]|nr:ABC transporter permease [Pyrodictium sp.]